jgi:NAD(P)-dependent dehydrogenase (short-subunit alcohol dehydrogenase family)
MLVMVRLRVGPSAGSSSQSDSLDQRSGTHHKLEGKIALVTGGNSGIGLATAKQFMNEGAHVFITGRRDPELAVAVKEIGRNVTGVQGDVSNLGDRLFAQIRREKGKLDIVFANAGMAKYAALSKISDMTFAGRQIVGEDTCGSLGG